MDLERWTGVLPGRKVKKPFKVNRTATPKYGHVKAHRMVRKSHMGNEKKVARDETGVDLGKGRLALCQSPRVFFTVSSKTVGNTLKVFNQTAMASHFYFY